MQRDARAFLWDARNAAEAITAFTRGKNFDDFAGDLLLRSAVERQFEIAGEALSQLAKSHGDIAAKVPDLRRIIAFRNLLIHGYAVVDRVTVWRVIEENLPELAAALGALLDAENEPKS
jgi:uncharacterized protein with HEPN domain